MSAYCVPLYDSLGENAIEFIIHHSEATIVFVASDKAANLAQALPLVKGQVGTVVYWGPKDAGVVKVRMLPACDSSPVASPAWYGGTLQAPPTMRRC